jgi:hypothetical protein
MTQRDPMSFAAKTDWVIMAAMEDFRTVRVKESRELPLEEGMPEVLAASVPEELCTFLRGGYTVWRDYKDQIVKGRD